MICNACEIKICSQVDYQKAFLRLTAIPAVGIVVNHKKAASGRLTASRMCSVFWLCGGI